MRAASPFHHRVSQKTKKEKLEQSINAVRHEGKVRSMPSRAVSLPILQPFMRIVDVWTPADRDLFLNGVRCVRFRCPCVTLLTRLLESVRHYLGEARLVYASTVGLTREYLAGANANQLIIAARNLVRSRFFDFGHSAAAHFAAEHENGTRGDSRESAKAVVLVPRLRVHGVSELISNLPFVLCFLAQRICGFDRSCKPRSCSNNYLLARRARAWRTSRNGSKWPEKFCSKGP